MGETAANNKKQNKTSQLQDIYCLDIISKNKFGRNIEQGYINSFKNMGDAYDQPPQKKKSAREHETTSNEDLTDQINHAVQVAVAAALAAATGRDQPQQRVPMVNFERPKENANLQEEIFSPHNDVNEKGELISLMAGDLIWLRSDGNFQKLFQKLFLFLNSKIVMSAFVILTPHI
jgi:hypothetical protein